VRHFAKALRSLEDPVQVDIYDAGEDLALYLEPGKEPGQVLSPADRGRFGKAEFRRTAEVAELGLDEAERAALEQAVAAKGYHLAGGRVAGPHAGPPNFTPQT
jgi:hypothetical protein